MKVYVNPKRFKYAKKVGNFKNKEIASALNTAKSTIDDITRYKAFDSVYLNEMCRLLDVSPEYLTDNYEKKADQYMIDCTQMTVAEYLEKYPESSPDLYKMFHSLYSKRIDPDGYFIPSYIVGLENKMEESNYDSFVRWLRSINYIQNPDDMDRFPTDAELDAILSRMSKDEILLFQANIVDSVVDYLVFHGFYSEEGNDEEAFEKYLSKINDRLTRIQKEGE